MGSFVPGDQEATEAFEMETLAEALESFVDELGESIEIRRRRSTTRQRSWLRIRSTRT